MKLNKIEVPPVKAKESPVPTEDQLTLTLAEKTAELASLAAKVGQQHSVAKLSGEERRQAGYELLLHVGSCCLDLTNCSYELFRLVEGELASAMQAQKKMLVSEIASLVQRLETCD